MGIQADSLQCLTFAGIAIATRALRKIIIKLLFWIWLLLKWTVIIVLLLFLSVSIAINIPAVQQFAIDKGASWFNETTGGELNIGQFELRLPSYLAIDSLSLHDQEGAQLLAFEHLDLKLGWRKLFGNKILVESINIIGLTSSIYSDTSHIKNTSSVWNYDFILEAFTANGGKGGIEPDSSKASPWEVEVHKINLQDFDLSYYDVLSRDSFLVSFDDLRLKMDQFSLQDRKYQVNQLFFAGSRIHAQLGVRETLDNSIAEEVSDSIPSSDIPDIGLKFLHLEDHDIHFTDLTDGSSYTAKLASLQLEPTQIDLNESIYIFESLEVRAFDLVMRSPASPPSDEAFDADIFIPLTVNAKYISINESNFNMQSFNPLNDASESNTSINLSNIHLVVEDVDIAPDRYALKLREAQIGYGELPELSALRFDLDLRAGGLTLNDLFIAVGRSSIAADIGLSYPALAALVERQKFSNATLDLSRAIVHPDDVASLLQALEPDSALPALPREVVEAQLKASGNSTEFRIEQLEVQTGSTSLALKGFAKGPKPEELVFNFSKLDLFASTADLEPWLPDSLDRSLLPPSISFAGKAKAGPRLSLLDGTLKVASYGDLVLDIESGGWKSEKYDLIASANSALIDLSRFAAGDTFYTCFELNVDMRDLGGDSLQGSILLDIPEIKKGNFIVSNIIVSDTVGGDLHRFEFQVIDSSLVASIEGSALIKDDLAIVLSGNVEGMDFEYLGISQKDIRLRTTFNASYTEANSARSGNFNFANSVVVKGDDRVDVAPISSSFFLGNDSTGVEINSELLTIKSTSNLSIDSLIAHGKDLFKENIQRYEDSLGYWDFDFKSGDIELLQDLLLPELKRFDPAQAMVRYRSNERSLLATLSVPYVSLGNLHVDSMALELRSNQGKTSGSFGVRQLTYDTLSVDQIVLQMQPDKVGTAFAISLGGEAAEAPYRIGFNLSHFHNDTDHYWALRPNENIYLAGQEWQVDSTASIHFADEGTEIKHVKLSRNQQKLNFAKEKESEMLQFSAQRFKLQTIAEVFSQEEELFAGLLSAGLELNSDGTFIGDGQIEGLELAGADFGLLTFGAEALENRYDIKANLKGKKLNMNTSGSITIEQDGVQGLDFDLNLEDFDAKILENLAPSIVRNASGSASGKMSVNGSIGAPLLNGNIKFNGMSIRIAGGGRYALRSEEIRISPQTVEFPNFTIADSAGQKLTVNGKIMHNNFTDIHYDLQVNSDQFTLLDVPEGDHPMFHGTLIVGSDIQITGTQARPMIRSDISLKRGSTMVFKVPESEYSSFDSDGLVEWVNFNERTEADILGRDKKEVTAPILETFIDLAGNLNIDKETKIRIIIDPLAGDYLEIEGGGKLRLGYDRAGRINLAGTYTVSSGAYQMTFYNVVKRRFLLEPGSRITWNGDPFSADLNLTAIYPTRASALGLLNTTASGAGSEGMRRMLDWEVLMLIEGELEQPEIGFDLRLDKSSQTSRGSMLGAIESRLVQLRENESELNRQVFALLVFNTFISEGGGGMSGSDMVNNQARNSASQLLTQQLNNLSNKLVGGVDLTFDLQSYGIEGASETDLSVDLSKTLFDDRVVVRVGSTMALEQNDPLADNSQQMMTNFILEYKITADGRYRLKAFRKTDVEDILVGRITRTGVGVVFRRSFDRGDQIFQKDSEEKALEEELKKEKEKLKQEKKNGNNKGNAVEEQSKEEQDDH